ncbi:MAG: hypothetical protein IPI07_18710 [Flavobacteriales bacterium]|nr:hypothetical protein [Flavobacteriales bacterium]
MLWTVKVAASKGCSALAFDQNYLRTTAFCVNYIFGGSTGSTRYLPFQVSADPNGADTAGR